MPAASVLLMLALLGAGDESARRKAVDSQSAKAVQQFKTRSGMTFAQCPDEACLLVHANQGCQPAQLTQDGKLADGTERVRDQFVHPPLQDEPKEYRNAGCSLTSFDYHVRDCSLVRTLCPAVSLAMTDSDPPCLHEPTERLEPCKGSRVSAAERARNLALAAKSEQDRLRVFATPTLIGVQGGQWFGLDYSRALPCLAWEATAAPAAACTDLGIVLFKMLEEGDACQADSDCSVLRGPVPEGACCVALGSEARRRFETEAWQQRLWAACGSADSHCPSCSAATCVSGRCRISPGEARIVWLNQCGYR